MGLEHLGQPPGQPSRARAAFELADGRSRSEQRHGHHHLPQRDTASGGAGRSAVRGPQGRLGPARRLVPVPPGLARSAALVGATSLSVLGVDGRTLALSAQEPMSFMIGSSWHTFYAGRVLSSPQCVNDTRMGG